MLDPFQDNVLFLYFLETGENLCFSDALVDDWSETLV